MPDTNSSSSLFLAERSAAAKVRPAMLQLVDHRGNVVVVDGGVRLAGALTIIPAHFTAGTEIEIVLIVGFEPVRLRVVVLEGCDARPGAIAIVSLAEWSVGGRRFVPNDAAHERRTDKRDRDDDDDVALKGRLQDVPVVEVVQLLCSGKREATIDIVDERCIPACCGALGVRDGRVVHAQTRDDVVGEAGFFALLGTLRGRFSVRFGRRLIDGETPLDNIRRDTTFLLLEHLRQLDEAARRHALQPQRAQVPRLESVPDGAVAVRPAMGLPLVVETSTCVPAFAGETLAPTVADGAPTVVPPPLPPPRPRPVRKTAAARVTKVQEPTTPRKRISLPPHPEVAAPTGRFSRFFAELSASLPAPPDAVPPPVGDDDSNDINVDDAGRFADDADLAITDALRFSSLQISLGTRESGFERDTDIVDRALISH